MAPFMPKSGWSPLPGQDTDGSPSAAGGLFLWHEEIKGGGFPGRLERPEV
jgi:hypothetical protein